jgi:hypothetical protein
MSFPFVIYDKLSRKPLLFKSFTCLSVQQFGDIYQKIEKKYANHETNRLLIHNKDRKRAVGAGRRFKLVVKDRVIMVLVYYRPYIAYTLMEFLFGLDPSNVCKDIQKIEPLIRKCLPLPQTVQCNQKVENDGRN